MISSIDSLSEVFGEFANSDRLSLLRLLNDRNENLTSLSGKVSLSLQECSRHLSRLSDANLIQRDREGHFEITLFGRNILQSLKGTNFIANNAQYFLSHDLSFLPNQFAERIGELIESEPTTTLSGVMRHIENAIKNAQEYIWLVSDQPANVSGYFLGEATRGKNAKVRIILSPSEAGMVELRSAMSVLGRNLEVGITGSVGLAIAMNENLAGLCFPDIFGKVDFNAGLIGKNDSFHSWCRDIVTYYWEISEKVNLENFQ